ncbi:DUF262 domain-containing HNH endonuclease family protein [Methanospirillum purgamenti]|uniref:DUF262 domain-containing HNH endonuclease family protein n=1 Tax=Methanospirillum hungatei TaxID=2203 RepID=A0A8F5VQ70_METHU|nr:DUF262 domain-containing protein [Methanospirillum hungatei]QXO95148.1 DUF262 domain-containing HNH endonuclease family protein [Methanospirillum hungatei]
MHAGVVPLEKLFASDNYFSLPIFQRRYEWKSKEWEALWYSIIQQYEYEISGTSNKYPKCFFGTIALKLIKSSEGSHKHDIIDGQQRITTIILLLAAIRDFFHNDENIFSKVNQLLKINCEGIDCVQHKKRLELALQDEKYLSDIISELPIPTETNSNVIDCYNKFSNKLDDSLDPYKFINSILTRFQVVWLTIENSDDAPTIFRTMNSTGTSLEDIDHFRIHILTFIDENNMIPMYHQFWKPIEYLFSNDLKKFPDFARYFLMKNGEKDIQNIFSYITEKINPIPINEREDYIRSFLSELKKSAEIYDDILNIYDASRFTNKVALRLKKFRYLSGDQYLPFLLNLLSQYSKNQPKSIDNKFEHVLHLIESFYIRGYFCDENMPNYTSFFSELCKLIDTPISTENFDKIEKKFMNVLPGDEALRVKIPIVPIYSRGSKNLAKLMLCSIEEHISQKASWFTFNPDESKISVEHIMPQKIENTDWEPYLKSNIGEYYKESHFHSCNTLGNLTLTSNSFNSKLGQKIFSQKMVDLTKCDGYNLNSYFNQVKTWVDSDIKKRSCQLSDYCILIWPGGTPIIAPLRIPQEGDQLVSITIKKRKYAINSREYNFKSWKGLYAATLYIMYKESGDKFRELVTQYPDFLSFESHKLKKEEQVGETSIYYAPLSGQKAVYQQCKIFVKEIGWEPSDWKGELKDKEGNVFVF